MSDISAVILAGGRSSRMGGRPKALLDIDGRKIIEIQISELSKVFKNIYIAGGDRATFSRYAPLIDDIYKGLGPIGGIYSALKTLDRNLFVFGSDMPFIKSELISKMCEEFERCLPDILFASLDGTIHPLHSVYSPSILDTLYNQIVNNRLRLMELKEIVVDVHYYVIDTEFAESIVNINTIEEYESYATKRDS
jgi:molybdopterin-guanine dinucleotide biosynthesis protein A